MRRKRIEQIWFAETIEREKEKIRFELSSLEQTDPKERLNLILRQLSNLQNAEEGIDHVRRYIYAITALVHHNRYGGLKNLDIQRIAEIAKATLQINGVKQGNSYSATLYSDIHMILSQIARQSGENWQAAWQHQLSIYASRVEYSGGDGFQKIITGNRLMRLGLADVAVCHFLDAENYSLTHEQLLRNRVELIRGLRFLRRFSEAQSISSETLALPNIDKKSRAEITWEELCRNAQATGNPVPLYMATRRDYPHYIPGYILEAYVWNWIPMEMSHKNMPRLDSLTRRIDFSFRGEGFFFECVQVLELCQNSDIPLSIRIEKLNHILEQTNKLKTIDKELLVWAAAARVLVRAKSYILATLALDQYQSLCKKLSRDQTSDLLRAFDDIKDKPGYRWNVDDALKMRADNATKKTA